MATVGGLGNQPRWRRLVLLITAFLGLFAGLCTAFALVVTVAEGLVERAQAQWPEAEAQVKRCDLDVYTHNPEYYWIDCSVSYEVRGEAVIAHVHSRTTPAPQRVIWQSPPFQFERMQEWVDEHPQGTLMRVHYDPANHAKAVLVVTDMPLGGPRSPDSLKLLGVFAGSCAVLLTIARTIRPRSTANDEARSNT